MKYLVLLRGVNVGGKNKIAMSELRTCLESMGFANVATFINSGNAIFESEGMSEELARRIEQELVNSFKFDSELIKVRVISRDELARIVKEAPKGFGEKPETYHSDVAFLIGEKGEVALKEFEVNPEVDAVWAGEDVIYYQRVSAKRTKSRLSRVIGKPIYKNMTIRSWSTTTKLLALLSKESS